MKINVSTNIKLHITKMGLCKHLEKSTLSQTLGCICVSTFGNHKFDHMYILLQMFEQNPFQILCKNSLPIILQVTIPEHDTHSSIPILSRESYPYWFPDMKEKPSQVIALQSQEDEGA